MPYFLLLLTFKARVRLLLKQLVDFDNFLGFGGDCFSVGNNEARIQLSKEEIVSHLERRKWNLHIRCWILRFDHKDEEIPT